MELIRGLHNLKNQTGCALTIGNFDGVHVGHQEIIKKLVSTAKNLNVPSLVVSFSVTPESFFGRPKARLSSFRDKHLYLKSLGVDKHLLIRFNGAFSQISAHSFIDDVLVKKIKIKYCYVGDDFRFGKDRLGDCDMLQERSIGHGFNVERVASVSIDNKRVSSSAIRKLLSLGDFQTAEKFLGRPFSISGRVAHGDKQGRTIGFPTANISIRRNLSPVLGVFSVLIKINNINYKGVCNVGKRPTLGGLKVLLEVFIFDFNQEIYGGCVTVFFKQKCREEIKFNSLEELKNQIKEDVKDSKQYFKDAMVD
jgi:riboflavin kinase / FMN adenylyltransferase